MTNLESCKRALSTFREEIRVGVLNETVPLWFYPSSTDSFLGDMACQIDNFIWKISVANTFVVYYDTLIRGLFDSEEDFTKLKEIVKRHLNLSA